METKLRPTTVALVLLLVVVIAAAVVSRKWHEQQPEPEAPPPPPAPHEVLLSYAGELRDSLSTLDRDNSLVGGLALRVLLSESAIRRSAEAWHPTDTQIYAERLSDITEQLNLLRKHGTYLEADDTYLLAYWSRLDDSLQPFRVAIPEEYDGETALPVIAFLHGQDMFNTLQCEVRSLPGFIVVGPQGRGGMDYMFVGEADVLRVIDETATLLNVDTGSVFLAGNSMGGTGAWHLATRFPDRFAGIAPMCGNTDIRVWSELWDTPTPKTSPQAAVRDFLRDDTSAVTYAENLFGVPVIAIHGEHDPINHVNHAWSMKIALDRLRHRQAEFQFLPYIMHGLDANFAFLANKMLGMSTGDTSPDRVHYKTAWLRYPGRDWLRITGMQKRLQHATIDGHADRNDRSLRITTRNVSDVDILLDRLPFTGRPSSVRIDGAVVALPPPPENGDETVLSLHKPELRAWQGGARPGLQGGPPRKSASVEGPVEHAFMSRFIVVYPRVTAEQSPRRPGPVQAAYRFRDMWEQRFGVPCRMTDDASLTGDDISGSNLVLFGGPAENRTTEAIIGMLPVKISGEGVQLGDRTYTGSNVGVKLCYPSSLDPSRYVVLIAGSTPESYLDINERFGNWFDWLPYDHRSHFDFAVFDDVTNGRNPETFLVWGFFNETWGLEPATTFEAVPAWRETSRPRSVPNVCAADFAQGELLPGELYLDTLMPLSADIVKEYVERNRTFAGEKLVIHGAGFDRGICMRFPSTVTFPCAGYTRLRTIAGIEWNGIEEPCKARKQTEKAHILIIGTNPAGAEKLLFEAEEHTYSDKPLEILADLTGAVEVTLSVSGGVLWTNANFIWADARLER